MRIKNAKISNILNFPYAENIDSAFGINFNCSRVGVSLHILIGPNGSGKSNFIEVLNQIIKRTLFRPFTLDENILLANERNPGTVNLQTAVTPMQGENFDAAILPINQNSSTDEQKALITLSLNENDFKNLELLNSNASTLDELRMKYSSGFGHVAVANIEQIRTIKEVQVYIVKNRHMPNFEARIDLPQNSPERALVVHYLTHFEAFQNLITIRNRFYKTLEDKEWPSLKRTFALMSSYRSFASVSSGTTISSDRTAPGTQIKNRLRAESTRLIDTSEPAVFENVRSKLAYRFFGELYPKGGLEYAINQLKIDDLYVNINRLVDKYLNLAINIRMPEPLNFFLEFYLENKQGRRVDPGQLSTGEKSILHLIFSLYGYDLENGVMIIDEPEIHLHPQMQRNFLQIINDIGKQFNIQFIIATHSPVFVNKDNIDNVHRFHSNEMGEPTVKIPQIQESQKSLTEILDYTNSSKIFFVNKVILVEGKTDEYFFRFYIDWLRRSDFKLSESMKMTSYEVLSIEGKQSVNRWKEFLRKFGLDTSFIGDWDNIEQVASFNIKKYEEIYLSAQKRAAKDICSKGSIDGANLFNVLDDYLNLPTEENLQKLSLIKDYIVSRRINYSALISYIKDEHADEWEQIKRNIESNYELGTYIFKAGELENYLGIKGKGLDKVIEFCDKGFDRWQRSDEYKIYRDELNFIIDKIFTQG